MVFSFWGKVNLLPTGVISVEVAFMQSVAIPGSAVRMTCAESSHSAACSVSKAGLIVCLLLPQTFVCHCDGQVPKLSVTGWFFFSSSCCFFSSEENV